jgi:hypothetical protein
MNFFKINLIYLTLLTYLIVGFFYENFQTKDKIKKFYYFIVKFSLQIFFFIIDWQKFQKIILNFKKKNFEFTSQNIKSIHFGYSLKLTN